MDQHTEVLVKLVRERFRASISLLANFHHRLAIAEQRIADSKVAISESLRLLAKPIDCD
jgi:hypothetical protein